MTSTSNNTPFATPATSKPNSRPSSPVTSAATPTAPVPSDNDLRDESGKLRAFLGLLKKYVIARNTMAACNGLRYTNWARGGIHADEGLEPGSSASQTLR